MEKSKLLLSSPSFAYSLSPALLTEEIYLYILFTVLGNGDKNP
jgi:hypothetical protein